MGLAANLASLAAAAAERDDTFTAAVSTALLLSAGIEDVPVPVMFRAVDALKTELARAYLQFGCHDHGERLLRAALSIEETLHGHGHPAALNASNLLSAALLEARKSGGKIVT